MNPSTLHKVSYGLYIISSKKGNAFNGQIANTVFQITSEPATVAISINKQNLTHEFIRESGLVTVSILSQEAPLSLIGTFGFKSGRDLDKFAGVKYTLGQNGVPIIQEHCVGYLEGQVMQAIDVQTHTVFIVKVTEAEITGAGEPMTYSYYHQVKKGTAPKTAPTYIEVEKKPAGKFPKYKCSICGYVYDPEAGDPDNGIKPGTPFEELPEDWQCPVCGVSKDLFKKEE
mgnify:CR=1 FL=1